MDKKSTQVAVTTLIIVLFLSANGQAHHHEPFYSDLSGHWARGWIEILWSEGVTDGYQVQTYSPALGWHRVSRFYPDSNIRLDAWTVLAAKVFDLVPASSARAYWLDSGQEVSRWLAAAQTAGWVPHNSDWKQTVNRESATRFLMTALGLADYSLQLSEAAISQALSRYRDRHKISSLNRPYIAGATLLGIVEGYPDKTFRPTAAMTRAEGATMLARSALARVEAKPNPFFPDGDGIEDFTDFHLSSLRNRNISRWELFVEDHAQRRLWVTGTRYGRTPNHPAYVRWYGTDSSGKPLPPGEYFYRFSVWDRQGQEFSSVRKPLRIGWRRLDGWLEPTSVHGGDRLSVWGRTWGDANKVTGTIPALGLTFNLLKQSSGDPSEWRAQVVVPENAAPGLHTLYLEAQFNGANRRLPLSFFVLDRVWIEAWLHPPVLPAGSRLTITAETSANVQAVTAHLPDGSQLPLRRYQAGRWEGDWLVPLDTAEGLYQVLVVGQSPYGPRQVKLEFAVVGDVREELQTNLTD